jgi:hypothetical protein
VNNFGPIFSVLFSSDSLVPKIGSSGHAHCQNKKAVYVLSLSAIQHIFLDKRIPPYPANQIRYI